MRNKQAGYVPCLCGLPEGLPASEEGLGEVEGRHSLGLSGGGV